MPPRVTLLGVPIDPLTQEQAVARIITFLQNPAQQHVMTPNSEMLVEAHRHPTFHALLRSTALNLPDSSGLLLMARLTGQHLPERVTGVDTVTRVCAKLSAEHSVFFLGGAEGVAEQAAQELKKRNPHLSIAGTFSGSPKDSDAADILRRITAARPHLLLVAFGAPAQDLWIAKHLKALPSVRVAIGVGGTFDFLAGKAKRAPKALRSVGLEWLWRLILEPWRIGRILRAVIVFPWLVLRSR